MSKKIKDYSPDFLKDYLNIEKEKFTDDELMLRAKYRLAILKKIKSINY